MTDLAIVFSSPSLKQNPAPLRGRTNPKQPHTMQTQTLTQTTIDKLNAIAAQLPDDLVPTCFVGEYSAEDDTPTLHIDIWRRWDLCDLSGDVHLLDIASEGHSDLGPCYSLQLPNPDEWKVGSDGRLYRH